MVEALTLKVAAWEEERAVEFSYDGVSNFNRIICANLMNLTELSVQIL